jgi:hypothetical protein
MTIDNLPDDGSPVYVKMVFWNDSLDPPSWSEQDSFFYQASGSGATLPSVVSPLPGAILRSSQTFQWDFGDYKVEHVGSFVFYLGTLPGGADIYKGDILTNTFVNFVTIGNLPEDDSTVYSTLWYWDGLAMQKVEYTYISGKPFFWPMFLPTITAPH